MTSDAMFWFVVSAFYAGLMAGLVLGLIPLLIGINRGHKKLAIWSLAWTALAGLAGGAVLAAPVAIGFSIYLSLTTPGESWL